MNGNNTNGVKGITDIEKTECEMVVQDQLTPNKLKEISITLDKWSRCCDVMLNSLESQINKIKANTS